MIKVNRKELLNELQFVAPACEKKPTIPELSTVRVIAKENGIHLTTTNLDLTIETQFEIDNPTENESFCVSLHDLLNALKNSPESETEITKEQAKILVVCGKTKYRLPIFEADKFPETPSFAPDNEITFNGAVLAEALSLTSFACTEEQSRFNYSGVFFKNNGKLNVWALDGYIVSYLTSKEQIAETEFDFVIPQKSARAFAALAKENESVKLSIEQNHVALEVGRKKLITRRTLAKSPNIDLLRKENGDHNLIFTNEKLQETVRACQSLNEIVDNTIPGRMGRFARLFFEPEGNEVKVSSVGGESAFEGIFEPQTTPDFPPFKVNGFDLQRLLLAYEEKAEIKIRTDGKIINGYLVSPNFEIEFINNCLSF